MAINTNSYPSRGHPDQLRQPDGSSASAVSRLTPLESLIVITLSSLGLWAAICWLVASLVSAQLW